MSETIRKDLKSRRIKVKHPEVKKIRLGRWILKEKIGVFIGCKSKVED